MHELKLNWAVSVLFNIFDYNSFKNKPFISQIIDAMFECKIQNSLMVHSRKDSCPPETIMLSRKRTRTIPKYTTMTFRELLRSGSIEKKLTELC